MCMWYPPNQMLSDYKANISIAFSYLQATVWVLNLVKIQKIDVQPYAACILAGISCWPCLYRALWVSFDCEFLFLLQIFSPWGHQFVSYWFCIVRRNTNRDILTFGYWDTSNIHQRASSIWRLARQIEEEKRKILAKQLLSAIHSNHFHKYLYYSPE